MTGLDGKEDQIKVSLREAGDSSKRPDGMQGIRLKLPATSANLGPGFDTLGLALSLSLTIQAHPASAFSIESAGRDAAVTGALDNNLIRSTYEEILRESGRAVLPLALKLENEIPLGMGCGSSAAALCAGVLLANHFGDLGWGSNEILHEAARREGHPDNVAACLFGGLTTSKTMASDARTGAAGETLALTLDSGLSWRLLLALPHTSLSTAKARRLLPDAYSRQDAVHNVQSTALLMGAFALNRPDLLRAATEDRLHQPYRMEACPLLAALLPLAGLNGVYSVTLSGAGPSVLLIAGEDVRPEMVREAGGDLVAEILELSIAGGALARAAVID